MWQTEQEQLSFKTLLHYINKFIIQNDQPFNSDQYNDQVDWKANEKFNQYINASEKFPLVLINDLLQNRALNKAPRENTDTQKSPVTIDDYDFQKICDAAGTLKLLWDDTGIQNKPYDIIVIPGALQSGTNVRIQTFLKYAEKCPDFQEKGYIIALGAKDRKMNPFTIRGDIKEELTFELIAQKQNKTVDEIKTELEKKYQALEKSQKKSETSITATLSNDYSYWPTEYDMVVCIGGQKLNGYNIRYIPTAKQEKSDKPCATMTDEAGFSDKPRATTTDEAGFIANAIKQITSVDNKTPHIGVITNFSYQDVVYRKRILEQIPDAQIDRLSPYSAAQEYINDSVKKRAILDGVEPSDEQQIRWRTLKAIADTLAKTIYSDEPGCPMII